MYSKEEMVKSISDYLRSLRVNLKYNGIWKDNYINCNNVVYDYEVTNFENCFFPNYSVFSINLRENRQSEHFFGEIDSICKDICKIIDNNGVFEGVYSFEKFNMLLIKSSNEINNLLSILDMPSIAAPNIKNVNFSCKFLFDNQVIKQLSKELVDLTAKLSKKLFQFIKTNNLFGESYKEELKSSRIYMDIDIYPYLKTQIENTKKVLDKQFIIDCFSDGKKEIEEMTKCLYDDLFYLCQVPKHPEDILYQVDDKKNTKLHDLLAQELKEQYATLEKDDLRRELNKLSIEKLEEAFNRLKIKKYSKQKFYSVTPSEKELEELIGLDGIKESIAKIKAYAIANKNQKDKLNLHMAFYGNPGTGKTIVARIIVKILFENGILENGKVVEVDRSDLVGSYVGETPYLTNNCIQRAMGGVLFIDEAYSLNQGDYDYGKEAIATLLKAMEDYRGKFCVIFAGYKNELEEMISINPGLQSRIQFNLDFPNYSKEELSQILDLMLNKKEYSIEEDAKNAILDLLEFQRKKPNFANAREVRNILEQVIMNLNLRDIDSKQILNIDVQKYVDTLNYIVPKSNNGRGLTGLEELDELIGLESVKNMVKKIDAYAKKFKNQNDFNVHMCFVGNPGTGKTEVARIISRIFYESGVLKEAKLIETNPNGLIGTYVGQTGPKTEKIVKDSLNGVLFIDEAYGLMANYDNSYTSEAITTLLKEMEDKRGKFCAILAGYKNEMNKLLNSNPGFESRIQFYIEFPDYSDDELRQIALKMLKKQNYSIADDAMDEILEIINFERKSQSFSNARTLRNILDKVILNQIYRTQKDEDNNQISIEDVDNYIEENKISIKKKKDKLVIDYETLSKDYALFDTSVIDGDYLEQSVISISGNNSQGTGFIISKNGLCLTCNHCIKSDGLGQQARIIYKIGNRRIKVYSEFKVLFKDEKDDWALIQLLDQDNEYYYLPLVDKQYEYKPLTEFIMAGYPFGGESFSNISITDGKIASTNIFDDREVIFANMFGKPGNSGSPVLDKVTKKVIGVFWGGISQENEMIPCFTPIKIIEKVIRTRKE